MQHKAFTRQNLTPNDEIHTFINSRSNVQNLCLQIKSLEDRGEFEAACELLRRTGLVVGMPVPSLPVEDFTRAELVLRLGVLTGWIGTIRQIVGYQEEAKNLLSISESIFQALGNKSKAAEAKIELGFCYWREGGSDNARIFLDQALADLSDEDAELKAKAILRIAIVERYRSKLDEAYKILSDASSLFEKINNHTVKGGYHVELGANYRHRASQSDLTTYSDKALVEYEAASYHFEQAGHIRYYANVQNNISNLLFRLARFDEAQQHLDRAIQIFKNLNDKIHLSRCLHTQACILIAQGRESEAVVTSLTAIEILQGDDKSVLAEAHMPLGVALFRLERFEEAEGALLKAINLACEVGGLEDGGSAALTLISDLGSYLDDRALELILQRAEDLLSETKNEDLINQLEKSRVFVGEAILNTARLDLKSGRLAEAENAASRATSILNKCKSRTLSAQATALTAEVANKLGTHSEALRLFNIAIDSAFNAGDLTLAGTIALTTIETMVGRINSELMANTYERADFYLNQTNDRELLNRLRKCAKLVLESQRRDERPAPTAPSFVTVNEGMKRIINYARQVAETKQPVIVWGAKGTGRRTLAIQIHDWSGLAGDFVPFDCRDYLDNSRSRVREASDISTFDAIASAARRAVGGTLFLDSVSELTLADQRSLLRLIEFGELRPVVSDSSDQAFIRIIASLEDAPATQVRLGKLSDQLCYRLNYFEIGIPPLFDRPDDAILLAWRFIKISESVHQKGLIWKDAVVSKILTLNLKENADSLKGLIEEVNEKALRGTIITPDLVESAAANLRLLSGNDPLLDNLLNSGNTILEHMSMSESELIQKALDISEGSVSGAARLLGIQRQTLAVKIEKQRRRKGASIQHKNTLGHRKKRPPHSA